MSLKKKFRLKQDRDFARVYNEGRKLFSPHFVLYISRGSMLYSRLGVAISRTHIKLATHRNRLRRVAKAFFRKNFIDNQYHQLKDLSRDMVLASRGKQERYPLKELETEIIHLLERAEQI